MRLLIAIIARFATAAASASASTRFDVLAVELAAIR
jgi:hypothetical protein